MQFVASSALALILVPWMLLRLRRDGLTWLFALLPFGMMAAVNLPALGGTSILVADLAVLGAAAALLVQPGGAGRLVRLFGPRTPGFMLLLFLLWATLATLFFPRIFAGQTEVFAIGRTAGQSGIISTLLQPGTGNLSQLLRMYLSALAFIGAGLFALHRPDPAVTLRAMVAVTGVHLALGAIDIATQALHLTGLMDWARTANYSLTLGQRLAGLNRMIGGFPEASSYGYMLLGLFGFWLSYWTRQDGPSRLPAILAVLTGLALLRSTSSSTYVGLALFLIVFAIGNLPRSASGRISQRSAAIAVVAAALVPTMVMASVTAYEVSPAIADFLDRALFTKLDSDSGIERMTWNLQALRNFWDTGMLGAGLGAVRASNWLVAALATVGLPGTLLLIGLLWRLFAMRPVPGSDLALVRLAAALQMGLAAFVCRALVVKGTANFDLIFFAMAGLAAGLVLASGRRRHA